MNIAQAIEIIEQYREQYGLGFLEALMEIRQNPEEVNERLLIAYRVFINAGQQMFAPA
jgi:hypothetical protein